MIEKQSKQEWLHCKYKDKKPPQLHIGVLTFIYIKDWTISLSLYYYYI